MSVYIYIYIYVCVCVCVCVIRIYIKNKTIIKLGFLGFFLNLTVESCVKYNSYIYFFIIILLKYDLVET